MNDQKNMTAVQLLREAAKEQNVKLQDIAEAVGKTRNALYMQLNGGRLGAEDWRTMARAVGYEVVMVKSDESPAYGSKIGRSARQWINGVTYDTDKAVSLCHTPRQGCFASELFMADDPNGGPGQYFVAHHSLVDGVDTAIVLVTPEAAQAFLWTYGL